MKRFAKLLGRHAEPRKTRRDKFHRNAEWRRSSFRLPRAAYLETAIISRAHFDHYHGAPPALAFRLLPILNGFLERLSLAGPFPDEMSGFPPGLASLRQAAVVISKMRCSKRQSSGKLAFSASDLTRLCRSTK